MALRSLFHRNTLNKEKRPTDKLDDDDDLVMSSAEFVNEKCPLTMVRVSEWAGLGSVNKKCPLKMVRVSG